MTWSRNTQLGERYDHFKTTFHCNEVFVQFFVFWCRMVHFSDNKWCLQYHISYVFVRSFFHDITVMSAMTSQITGVSIVCSIVSSGADQRKNQNSAVTGLLWGESLQRASNAENVSIWWRHDVFISLFYSVLCKFPFVRCDLLQGRV